MTLISIFSCFIFKPKYNSKRKIKDQVFLPLFSFVRSTPHPSMCIFLNKDATVKTGRWWLGRGDKLELD